MERSVLINNARIQETLQTQKRTVFSPDLLRVYLQYCKMLMWKLVLKLMFIDRLKCGHIVCVFLNCIPWICSNWLMYLYRKVYILQKKILWQFALHRRVNMQIQGNKPIIKRKSRKCSKLLKARWKLSVEQKLSWIVKDFVWCLKNLKVPRRFFVKIIPKGGLHHYFDKDSLNFIFVRLEYRIDKLYIYQQSLFSCNNNIVR